MNNKININKPIELEKILNNRFPPTCWDIAGYIFGLFMLINDNFYIKMFAGTIFVSYGLLNIVFDTYTVSIEYTNNMLPNYDKLGFYNFTIMNKKYNLKNSEGKKNNTNATMNDFLLSNSIVDSSNIKLELSFYVGHDENIEKLLNYIYLFGITKKNYTQINHDELKHYGLAFV